MIGAHHLFGGGDLAERRHGRQLLLGLTGVVGILAVLEGCAGATKCLDHHRVELDTRVAPQLLVSLGGGQRDRTIGPRRCHGLEGVGDMEHAGEQQRTVLRRSAAHDHGASG